jgi:hypothetical protein
MIGFKKLIPKKNKSADFLQLKKCKIIQVAKIMTGFLSMIIFYTSGLPSLPEVHDYISFYIL